MLERSRAELAAWWTSERAQLLKLRLNPSEERPGEGA
jgi:hypothetical protein